MNILSIDTASDICGVSILKDKLLLCNLDSNTGRTHSENLMLFIQTAFEKTGLHLKDIDLIVCDEGPGSFTGIRIGIATAKAFHDSLDIPCIGISSLESLSYNIKNDGLICSLIDCKHSNCYFALYQLENSIYKEIIYPSADSIENICNTLNNSYANKKITFVGDGSLVYKDILNKNFSNAIFTVDNNLNSYNLGIAGLYKFIKSNKASYELLPLYLKKPQAQRLLEEKNNLERCDGHV